MTAAEEALLRDLRRMWEARDPVPVGLADEVLLRLAPELDDDVELLAIQEAGDLMAGVRGDRTATVLAFAADRLEVLLRISALPRGRRRLDGWLAPAVPGSARLTVGGRVHEVAVAASGRFELADLPPGGATLDLVVRPGDEPPRRLRTPTFAI
jgi:hypothetical protein